MALSTENANLVWQKVKNALATIGSPAAQEAFLKLKAQIAQVLGNPDLQFVAVSDLTGDTAVADAACKIYGVYFKKQATATASYAKVNDSATTCGGANGAAMTDMLELNAASQEAWFTNPRGRAMASGIAIAAETTGAGGTDTTTGDGPNGFVILGKP